jgi:hypothetical protein
VLRCPVCSQDNPEVARFCLACGSALAAPAPEAAEERRRTVTIVSDLVQGGERARLMFGGSKRTPGGSIEAI